MAARGGSSRDDGPETLVGVSFPDVYRAQEFMTAATRLSVGGSLHLKDAVLVVKNDNGHSIVRETTDPQPARSAISGALWAGLLGVLVGGPIGWLAGTAIGAGAGAVTAKAIDIGIPDEWVGWFREASAPGTATVALLVTGLDRDALVREAERFAGARLLYANLDDETLSRIRGALGQPEGWDGGITDGSAPGPVPAQPPS